AKVEVTRRRELGHDCACLRRRPPGRAREGDGEAHEGTGGHHGEDQAPEHQRWGSWARGNRWAEAKSRTTTEAANPRSTTRRASGMRGAHRAAEPTVNSHRSRARNAHAWRRTEAQQTGYLAARTAM